MQVLHLLKSFRVFRLQEQILFCLGQKGRVVRQKQFEKEYTLHKTFKQC